MLASDVAREQNPHALESIIRNDDSGKRKSAVVQAPVSRLYLYTSDAQRVLVFFLLRFGVLLEFQHFDSDNFGEEVRG